MAWIEKRPRKRGGQSYRVYWRDPASKVKARMFARERAAQAFAREIEVRKDRSTYTDPALGKVPLAEFFEHFMKTGSLRPTTESRYRTHGKLYVLPQLGERPLNTVTRADVAQVLAELAASKGPATVESVRRILHRMFEVALSEDRIGRNPVHGVKVAASERREPRFLSGAEVARVAAEVPVLYRSLVYFLAYSGLRIGEASALRIRNVDLERGIVRVVESSPEVNGHKLEAQPTKSRKVRAVHLGPRLVEMLKAHLATHGTPLDPASLVFTGPQGAAIRQNAFRKRILQSAAERAGIQPTPTVHDLRHTAASLMAKAGYSMREAQDMLGHSHATMTDRYTHLFPADGEARVRRLDELMVTSVTKAEVVTLRS
jgi:integrase